MKLGRSRFRKCRWNTRPSPTRVLRGRTAPFWVQGSAIEVAIGGEVDLPLVVARPGSYACDVGGQEVDAVAVEVAAGAVVVLGGPGISVTGEDLGIA